MGQEESVFRCQVKEFRQQKGLSQEELAALVRVRRQAIYDIESGRYLPNTAVAIRLAKALGCTVEMLFVEDVDKDTEEVRVLGNLCPDSKRLALARVRDTLVGVPLRELERSSFGLRLSDGMLSEDKLHAELFVSRAELEKTLLILGCDPALGILHEHLLRTVHGIRAHTVFASSKKALQRLAAGEAHVAGTHFHSSGGAEANIAAVEALLPDMASSVIAFSLQEEGLMVAGGNPLGIRDVEDLASGSVRFVNREEGAALRKLLDTRLAVKGVSPELISGYSREVYSHAEGAFHIACRAADAALGLRIVAESFGLDFIPLAVTRADLVIPLDLQDQPGVAALLDLLQSSRLSRELHALPGYDAAFLGKVIV